MKHSFLSTVLFAFGLLASLSIPFAWGGEGEGEEEEGGPQIPAQCDLYANASYSGFSCCMLSYQEKSAEAFAGLFPLKYIHVEFYARHEIDRSLEDFLSQYFTFKNWPSYVESQESQVIEYKKGKEDLDNDGIKDPLSFGMPSTYKLSHPLITHRSQYRTTARTYFGIPISVDIEEITDYVKRERPKLGARISYDFDLKEGVSQIGIEEKNGEIHVFEDDDGENFLFVLKFKLNSGEMAKYDSGAAERTALLGMQDILKGMMGTQDDCYHEHLNDLKTDKDGNILN